MEGELHDFLLHGDGVVPDEVDEGGAALYLFLFVDEPALDGGGLFVQRGFDLAGCAVDEDCLCLVVANPADRHDKHCHNYPHEEKLLFDTQDIPFLPFSYLADMGGIRA